jgi:hypothetical protein
MHIYIPDTTINHLPGTPSILVALLQISPRMTYSAHLDSGGQRKRVNVGLEAMVMEPSDELANLPAPARRCQHLHGGSPTQVGLHSPDQRLKCSIISTLPEQFYRCACCCCTHYDLILLAKGGVTMYHGPVKKVEGYFTGLGIAVPERVNPPDYYIDILEGPAAPVDAAQRVRRLAGQAPPYQLSSDSSNKTCEDLSNRRTRGILRQYRYFLGR